MENKSSCDLKAFDIQKETIWLNKNTEAFLPSIHGVDFANHVRFENGEKAIDIGTGSGLLAILAAKKGADATATDISEGATKATMHNAEINEVTVDVRQGCFFADTDEEFNVITANLAQTIVPPHLQRSLTPEQLSQIDGGQNGNRVMRNFLPKAAERMTRDTRLYVPVYSTTDFQVTKDEIHRRFDARFMAEILRPVKKFIKAEMGFYRELYQKGIIHLVEKDGQLYSYQWIYECRIS